MVCSKRPFHVINNEKTVVGRLEGYSFWKGKAVSMNMTQ